MLIDWTVEAIARFDFLSQVPSMALPLAQSSAPAAQPLISAAGSAAHLMTWPVATVAGLMAVAVALLLAGLLLPHRWPKTARSMLFVAMALAALDLLLASLWLTTGWADLAAIAAALAVLWLGARQAAMPWPAVLALVTVTLGSMNFAIERHFLATAELRWPVLESFLRRVEFPALLVLALGIIAVIRGLTGPGHFQLTGRAREADGHTAEGSADAAALAARSPVPAIAAALVVLWAFATVAGHLLWRQPQWRQSPWFGPWLVGLAVVLFLGGLAFLQSVKPLAAPRPVLRRRRAAQVFGGILLGLAGLATCGGLWAGLGYLMATTVSLSAIFTAAVLAATSATGRLGKGLQLIASVTLPFLMGVAAVWVANLDLWGRADVVTLVRYDLRAALAFAAGAVLVYLLGLLVVRRQGGWSGDAPLMTGLGLSLIGFVWLASFSSGATVDASGLAGMLRLPDAVSFYLYLMAALLMVSAWRAGWQPIVYLAALELMVAVGQDTARAAVGQVDTILLRNMTSTVAVAGAGLAVAGAILSLWRRRESLPLARFYHEGLLVMGLVGAALMALLAAVGVWETGLSGQTLALLASLAVTLLVNAAVFRQLDLFGFFGVSVLMLALAAFAVSGPHPVGYLYRYSTVSLAVGLALSLVAALVARRRQRAHEAHEDRDARVAQATGGATMAAVPGDPAAVRGSATVRDATSARDAAAVRDVPEPRAKPAAEKKSAPAAPPYGAALYAGALVAAALVLALLALTRNFYWRGADLIGVAVILLMIRPHVRQAVTNFACAAAVTAAVYYILAGRWKTDPDTFYQAALIATAALSLLWLIVAKALRWFIAGPLGLSEAESFRQTRPFTVTGIALAVGLALYLTFLTALVYHGAWIGHSDLPGFWPLDHFNAAVVMVAWVLLLLTMLLSMWVFRHSARTFAFYLFGSFATISAGLLFTRDPADLLSYIICAVAGYGAMHLLVYLAERRFMALLSRTCHLYHYEAHASTVIFTASCISCFIGAIVAAFYLYDGASLVTLCVLTAVFFIWAFGHQRTELMYPAVLISVEALLSIWHNAEGPGPWTATRVNINALVFAAGGLLWLGVGQALNRLRGPMGLLNTPARQMSVVLALTGLGFFVALALTPLWTGALWTPDRSPLRLVLGLVCGAALMTHFAWGAASFRRTGLIYLAELALAATTLFVLTRTPALWQAPLWQSYWTLILAVAALALLGVALLCEWRRWLLFSRPLFFTAVFFLPIIPAAGAFWQVYRGSHGTGPLVAGLTFLLLAVDFYLGSRQRMRAGLLALMTAALVLSLACFALLAWLH